MTITDIQKALVKAGFLPGPIDGAWGRQTAAAVRAFQKSNGLDIDGQVGPATSKALAPFVETAPAASVDLASPLLWLAEAWRQFGTKETPGPASNRTILDWATAIGIPYKSDDVPWCGLFVSHCIASTLDREPLPGDPLGARAWSRFGIPITASRGAVMVFWRKSPQSGLGHVGFYVGEDATAYCILGGNQSDSVSLAWVAKDRLVGARWPSTFPPSLAGPTLLAKREDALSQNEA